MLGRDYKQGACCLGSAINARATPTTTVLNAHEAGSCEATALASRLLWGSALNKVEARPFGVALELAVAQAHRKDADHLVPIEFEFLRKIIAMYNFGTLNASMSSLAILHRSIIFHSRFYALTDLSCHNNHSMIHAFMHRLA